MDIPLLYMRRMQSADQDERDQEPRSTFVLYSLRTYPVVKLVPLPGLGHMFEANEYFVIIVCISSSYRRMKG